MLLWITCVICALSAEEVWGRLMGNCSGVDLPCQLHKFSGNAYREIASLVEGYESTCDRKEARKARLECLPSALALAFPGIYVTNTSNFPGMPGSLDISAGYKYAPKKDTYKPEVNLTFTPPQSGAKNYVKGFEVTRSSVSADTGSCYILDLSNVTWNSDISELATKFKLELFPLLYRYNSFTLYSLPKQQVQNEIYDQYISKYVELPEYVDNMKAGSWRASMYRSQNSKNGSVLVNIDPPPAEFGFQEFEYTLLDADTNSIQQQHRLRQLHVEFKGLYANHRYKVWVKPYDPYYGTMDPDQCLCLDVDEMACAHCMTTTTEPFDYIYTGPQRTSAPVPTIKVTTPSPPQPTKGPSTPEPTSGPEEVKTTESMAVSNVQVAMAIVGSLLGIGLILGIAGFLYFRRCRGSFDNDTKDTRKHYPDNDDVVPVVNLGFNGNLGNKAPNNLHAEKILFGDRPKLILLYEEDHEYHRQVVQHFATYLQQHCHCATECVEWQLDVHWAHEDIAQADYVVIVNSEGAYQSYVAQYGQKGNRDFKGSPKISKQMANINSVRNKFFHDERYDNVVMVYFEYTDERFVIPDICPGYKYKLLKHFTDFLLHIHKLRRTDNLSLYDLPLDGSFIKKPIGQKLLEAMSKVKQYQLDNPNWIKKKQAYNRMYSHTSDESQFDSGLPEDWNRIPSVEHTLSHYQSNPDERDLLDTESCYTFRPEEIGVVIPPESGNLSTVSENVPSVSVPKSRPKLSPHSFSRDPDLYYQNTPTPPTCGTVESDFCFFPPEDDFDNVSKTVSEQMRSIVDRYQAVAHGKPFDSKLPETSHEEAGSHVDELPYHINVNPTENYDRNNDLFYLRVQSGEIPFPGCHIDGDVVSLGGESV